jgi:hypothetical protein
MEQQPAEALAKAVAFASGLRKHVTLSGRRWAAWPGGAATLAQLLACIEGVVRRLPAAPDAGGADAALAAGLADLRAILEWTTYQSASLATVRALQVARRTKVFAESFGLLDGRTPSFSILVDADESLIESVRTRNGYMQTLAERHPDVGFPPPLVTAESLTPKKVRPPGKLDLIQALTKRAKKP